MKCLNYVFLTIFAIFISNASTIDPNRDNAAAATEDDFDLQKYMSSVSSSSGAYDVPDLDQFYRILKGNHSTLVKFYAPWCGHCRNLSPIYDAVAKSLASEHRVRIIKINADHFRDVIPRYDIKGFPTIKLFAPGGQSYIDVHDRTEKGLKEFVSTHLPKIEIKTDL